MATQSDFWKYYFQLCYAWLLLGLVCGAAIFGLSGGNWEGKWWQFPMVAIPASLPIYWLFWKYGFNSKGIPTSTAEIARFLAMTSITSAIAPLLLINGMITLLRQPLLPNNLNAMLAGLGALAGFSWIIPVQVARWKHQG